MKVPTSEIRLGDFITVDVGYGHPMDSLLVEVTRLFKHTGLFN